MAETKVNNSWFWGILWAIVIVGAVFASVRVLQQSKEPVFTWRRVMMDGHRSGVVPLNAENAATGLGVFTDETYVTPSGVKYPADSPVAEAAQVLMDVQPRMAILKQVVAHSALEMENLRTVPDLPLGNFVADAFRSFASDYFKVPMDFSLVNYGGIRIPMPKGAVTLEDMTSMFPFKNYLVYCKVKGENLTRLLEQLAGTPAFQAVSGVTVKVKDHKLESALIGGKPIDPERIYNVASLDFLLDGGDQIRLGALSEDVVLTHVLVKEVILAYVTGLEKRGEVIDAKADGRVIMEDSSNE